MIDYLTRRVRGGVCVWWQCSWVWCDTSWCRSGSRRRSRGRWRRRVTTSEVGKIRRNFELEKVFKKESAFYGFAKNDCLIFFIVGKANHFFWSECLCIFCLTGSIKMLRLGPIDIRVIVCEQSRNCSLLGITLWQLSRCKFSTFQRSFRFLVLVMM